jgi:hypothetical protein
VTKLGPCQFKRLPVHPDLSVDSEELSKWREMYERLGDLGQDEENLDDLGVAFEGAWTPDEMRKRLEGKQAALCKQHLSGDYPRY